MTGIEKKFAEILTNTGGAKQFEDRVNQIEDAVADLEGRPRGPRRTFKNEIEGITADDTGLRDAQKKYQEALAEVYRLRNQANGLNRGVDFGFDLDNARAGVGMATSGGPSRGTFNASAAAQFFGGNNLQEKQLKAIEGVKAEVKNVVNAIMGMPIARIT